MPVPPRRERDRAPDRSGKTDDSNRRRRKEKVDFEKHRSQFDKATQAMMIKPPVVQHKPRSGAVSGAQRRVSGDASGGASGVQEVASSRRASGGASGVQEEVVSTVKCYPVGQDEDFMMSVGGRQSGSMGNMR